MRAHQRINLGMHVYLLTQRGLNQRIPSWHGAGPFIDPEHVPYDVTNYVIP